MSTYYEFYVAVRRCDKIEAIGPYVRKEDGSYKLRPILTRSRSFINWNEFDARELPVGMMAEDQVEFFTQESWTNDSERYSVSHYLSYNKVCSMADDEPLQGYVTLDELDFVAKNDYDQECIWDLDIKSTEMVAEMDPDTRKNYGHIAVMDRNSTGYICSILVNVVDPIDYGVDEKNLYFIVRVC